MKKSTILLLAVVYIISFFIIGLLGHSIKTYNPEIYPESIEVIDPDNRTTVSKDIYDSKTGELQYHYYFVLTNYRNGDSVRIKATVKPDKCTYSNVNFIKDISNTTFNLATIETNPNIEQNFALITLNEVLDKDNPILTTAFSITSTNPGSRIVLKIGVTFVSYELSL